VPRRGWQRFFVHDFEVDQARSIILRVINDIGRGRVAVRPTAAKLVAPKVMGAMKFLGCRC